MEKLTDYVRFDAPRAGLGTCTRCKKLRRLIAQSCTVPVDDGFKGTELKCGTLLVCKKCLKVMEAAISKEIASKREAKRISSEGSNRIHAKGMRRKFRQRNRK